jgi:hypothetical protein
MENLINDEHERKIQNDNMKERMTTERRNPSYIHTYVCAYI